jgi:hypothetical protein
MSAVQIEPADKAPSFFPESHNLGLLEIVNNEYVAKTTLDLELDDAVDWGLIDDGSGGGGGGGGGGGEAERRAKR